MTRERASLEDIFVRLTTHDVAAGTVEDAPAAAQAPDEPADEAPAEETPSEETPS
jgi:hypothetical protein